MDALCKYYYRLHIIINFFLMWHLKIYSLYLLEFLKVLLSKIYLFVSIWSSHQILNLLFYFMQSYELRAIPIQCLLIKLKTFCCWKYCFYGLCDFRTDTMSLQQCYFLLFINYLQKNFFWWDFTTFIKFIIYFFII
jgi:hypothetical protein